MSAETLYSHFTDLTHTPRMWGRQSAFTGNIVCTRNTPTHVGKTKFECIRRIRGYLVGTLDRFNDAKRAEEADRVKHM